MLDRLLDAIELQRDARPETEQDWSTYIRRVVFEGEAGLTERMRAHPATAALQRRLERLTSGGRDTPLPIDDLVHGDFVLNNMLLRGDAVYVVDAAHAGKGTRAYDLATLLMETVVGGDYRPPSLLDQRRIEETCLAIVGRLGFLVCVACRIMHLLVWGGVHWTEDVPRTSARCHAFLDSLESARGEYRGYR